MGIGTLPPVEETVAVCGLPVLLVWDLILLQKHPSYCLVEAFSLSLKVEYLFFFFLVDSKK